MRSERLILRGVIYFLLLGTFFLGLPSFHYTVALMIALIIRHKDVTTTLFTPIDSYRLPGHGIWLEPLLVRLRTRRPRRL